MFYSFDIQALKSQNTQSSLWFENLKKLSRPGVPKHTTRTKLTEQKQRAFTALALYDGTSDTKLKTLAEVSPNTTMQRIIAALLLYMYIILLYMCSSGCAMRHEELTGAHAPRRQFPI